MKNSNDHVQVIGAGFGRTGTSSLKQALNILGYNTYHMTENFKHGHYKFWIRVANNNNSVYHFNEIFKDDERESYTATCDFPCATYWAEQLNQYPQAKVILTKRDPEKWYKSCLDTIFRLIPCSPHCDPLVYCWTSWLGVPSSDYGEFLGSVIARDTFHHDWSKKNVIQCYNDHNKRVQQECPQEQLLVFDVAEGWKPLCEFLDKPIPNVPFPHANDTKEFSTLFRNVRIVTSVIVLVLPAIIAAGAYCWLGKKSN
jgi:hypothetical protein